MKLPDVGPPGDTKKINSQVGTLPVTRISVDDLRLATRNGRLALGHTRLTVSTFVATTFLFCEKICDALDRETGNFVPRQSKDFRLTEPLGLLYHHRRGNLAI